MCAVPAKGGPMTAKSVPPAVNAAEVRALLAYDPETGHLTWRVKPSRRVHAGTRAGGHYCRGYEVVSIKRRRYQAHRLIWLVVHGRWPRDVIDHVNGDRADNRLSNLRECSHAENMQNISKQPGKSSQFLGVCYIARRGYWVASITTNGRRTRLGIFSDEAAAYAAYCEAKRKHHRFSPKPRPGALDETSPPMHSVRQ